MQRREFLGLASALALSGLAPEWLKAAPRLSPNTRIVVLVELKGGNDGFNTLVPFDDDHYYHLRPHIGIRKNALLPLRDGFGMHRALQPLKSVWDSGEMAWIQGVGYPNGVLSHFRSMDIWESGITQGTQPNGWLTRVLPRYKRGLHGIVLSREQNVLGPLKGHQLNTLCMQNPGAFLKQAERLEALPGHGRTAALAHLTQTHQQLLHTRDQIASRMQAHYRPLPVRFSKGPFGHGLKHVAEMIALGIDAPVYKVTQSGFDTHVNQPAAHNQALYNIGHGLSSFAEAMKGLGVWDQVLVVTYSEFGRRATENRGRGTDHGTASTHFAIGGRVRGGFYGRPPNLQHLDENDNVAHTTDFRSLYATLAQRWWRQTNPWGGLATIPFV